MGEANLARRIEKRNAVTPPARRPLPAGVHRYTGQYTSADLYSADGLVVVSVTVGASIESLCADVAICMAETAAPSGALLLPPGSPHGLSMEQRAALADRGINVEHASTPDAEDAAVQLLREHMARVAAQLAHFEARQKQRA